MYIVYVMYGISICTQVHVGQYGCKYVYSKLISVCACTWGLVYAFSTCPLSKINLKDLYLLIYFLHIHFILNTHIVTYSLLHIYIHSKISILILIYILTDLHTWIQYIRITIHALIFRFLHNAYMSIYTYLLTQSDTCNTCNIRNCDNKYLLYLHT